MEIFLLYIKNIQLNNSFITDEKKKFFIFKISNAILPKKSSASQTYDIYKIK